MQEFHPDLIMERTILSSVQLSHVTAWLWYQFHYEDITRTIELNHSVYWSLRELFSVL